MKSLFALAILVLTVSAQAAAPRPFEGLATMTIAKGEGSGRTAIARISRDKIFVAPANRTFNRYIITNYDPQDAGVDGPITASLTLYYGDDDQVFTYFWDTGSVRSEETFKDDGALFNQNSWVLLSLNGNVLTGTTYPGDPAEQSHQIKIENGRVTLTTREYSTLAGIVPIPHTTVLVYDQK